MRARKEAGKETKTMDTTEQGGMITVTVNTQRNAAADAVREALEVHKFQTEPARVEVHHGCTRNVEGYEYLRVDVTVSMPCYREEVESTLAAASELVYNRVEAEVAAAMGEPTGAEEEESAVDYSYAELSELTDPELEEIANANGIKLPRKSSKNPDLWFNTVVEALNIPRDEEADASEEEGDEVTYEYLSELEDDDLLALAKEEKVKLTAKDKKDMDVVFEKVCEHFGIEMPEEEEGEAEEEEGEEITYDYLADLEDEELLELAKEEKIKLTAKDKKDMDVVFEKVCEHFDVEAPEEEEAEEEEGEEEITYDYVANLEDDELLELAKEHKVKLSAKDKKDMDVVFEKVCEHLGLDEEEEEIEESEEEELTADDVNAMTLEELTELHQEIVDEGEVEIKLTKRELKNQKALAKALIKALDL